MTKKWTLAFLVLSMLGARASQAQSVQGLELLDPRDAEILRQSTGVRRGTTLDLSDLEQIDDLQSLKSDIGEFIFDDPNERPGQTGVLKLRESEGAPGLPTPARSGFAEPSLNDPLRSGLDTARAQTTGPLIFDVGEEERKLLELSRFVEGKIPDSEWNEIASRSNLEKYVVQQGDWLWKISQRLFGSGFYYSKIWALNPHITNPHEIEPGMTLIFDSGTASSLPSVRVGQFTEERISDRTGPTRALDFRSFGEGVEVPWLRERQQLIDQGVYFQFSTDETYEDLMAIGNIFLQTDYERYDPPPSEIIIREPDDSYDNTGFGRDSVIQFDVRQASFLNTFVTTNIVQDLGEIVAMPSERVFVQNHDRVYMRFDNSVRVRPGDLFSVYGPGGRVRHKVSDRSGFRYTIIAQVKIMRKINDLWEAEVTEVSGIVQRRDRLTVYTPRIGEIVQTFNRRIIEAAIIGAYRDVPNSTSYGDIVYIDRGRADGVEMGNVFELYSFIDRGTGSRITLDPTYKVGELTVITLTDNFATAIITHSSNEIPLGTIGLTKTADAAALASQVRTGRSAEDVRTIERHALEELDIELNLDDLGRDLLRQADRIQLTEDELEELERQERERSIIQDHERDLRELERLEREMIEAERSLNEARVDEDRFLEQHDLERIERQVEQPDPNAFRSLDEIERELGRRYLDEDLNARDNPFGLTEFDLEEIDELLNTGRR
jgi:hypothetical protein